MAKRDMKSALKGSIESEERAIESRFEKAEAVFGNKPIVDSESKVESPKIPKKRKVEKIKVIRDSFTLPQLDYDLIKILKQRSLKAGVEITKSEIIRAGLQSLDQMTESDFLNRLGQIEKIKTGRPKGIT